VHSDDEGPRLVDHCLCQATLKAWPNTEDPLILMGDWRGTHRSQLIWKMGAVGEIERE
jgi:hypothetical protein